MDMGINRGVGTKEAQSGVHEVTFMFDDDVAQGLFVSFLVRKKQSGRIAPCGMPKADDALLHQPRLPPERSIFMLRLFLDPSSPPAVSAAASLFGSQALQGASRKRLHAWFRVIAVPSSIDGASLEVFLPIGV
jgi:hypothetical protein